MRLNAVWGLEPNANSIDIKKAEIDKVQAIDGGVLYECVDDERKLSVHELGDSELDKMILLFQK